VPTQATSERVRLLVVQQLSTGGATHDWVSRRLGMHPRTMQRRLVEEGTTFEKIKDEVRRELVRKLVERPDMPAFASVAGMLDYAEPSALTRSCHRWFGASPTELRRQSMHLSGD
jgi:AraC-like DNA-binding protein